MSTSDQAHRLNQRINAASARNGVPVARLRNRIAYQRMLARLSLDQAWVLKGGFSLEVRLGLVARATKDLDLWRLGPPLGDPLDVQDLLDEALDHDLHDGFTFRVGQPRHMHIPDAEPSTWRISVHTFFHGSTFAQSSVDLVTSDHVAPDESEPLTVQPTVVGDPFTVQTIDLARHAAEKYHACLRIYANDRPSTRVKDLVDLVLLIDNDLIDPARLRAALTRVFAERHAAVPPRSLPDHPPADWGPTYIRLAAETGATVDNVDQAWALAQQTYRTATQ